MAAANFRTVRTAHAHPHPVHVVERHKDDKCVSTSTNYISSIPVDESDTLSIQEKPTTVSRIRRIRASTHKNGVSEDFGCRPPSAADVSIPGMGKLFDNDYCISGKVAWGVAILVCFVVCTIQIANRIEEYLSVPVDSNVEVEKIAKVSIPSITICPYLPFINNLNILNLRKQYATRFKISYDNDTDLVRKVESLALLDLPGVDANLLWKLASNGNVTVQRLCEFRRQVLKDENPCNQKKLKKRNLETYDGLCTTYSLYLIIKYDGSYNGYEVFLEPEDTLPGVYWHSMIMIHQNNDRPRHKAYLEGGQVVHHNFETTITFETKKYLRQLTPSHPCVSQQDHEMCYWKCIDRNVARSVTCRLPYLTNKTLPMCKTSSEARRTDEAMRETYDLLKNGSLCSDCPRKCIEKVYSFSQDVVKPQHLTWLKVLFKDNIVNVVKEELSYSFPAFISEIGGSLGLFLGVCLLTTFQLLEILVSKIKNRFWPRR